MRNLAIGAVIVAVVLAVVLGIQVNQKNALEADVKEYQATATELETVKASLEDTQKQLSTLSEEKTTQDAQLEEARKGVEDALEQVTALSEENAGLLTTVGTGKEDAEKLLADKAALEEQVAALTKTGDDAATQLEAARKEAEDTKSSLAAVQQQLQDLTQAKESLEGEVAALKDDAEKAAAKAEEDAKLLEELTSKAAELETARNELQARNEELIQAAEHQPAEIAATAAEALEPVSIHIFHTNDVHSRVEGNDKDLIGYAKLATLVKDARAQGPALLVDVGDGLHGMSFATAVQGESMVQLMNLLGYDAMTPGNHDFNYGYERLKELEKGMDFPLLNANIATAEDGMFAFEPYVIKEVGGKRIALVGAANPQIQSAIHPDRIKGLSFEGEGFVAQAVEQALTEHPDAVIILAHWGADGAYNPNSSVLAKIPGVNLVIDGHSHTRFEDIEQTAGSAIVVSAYEYLKTVGHLVMHFDANNAVTIEVTPITFEDAAAVEPDAEVQDFIEKTAEDIKAATSEVVGKTNIKLEGAREEVRTRETNLGDLAADALRLNMEADFAVTNGGGIRTSVEPGDITKGNLIEVFPFGNSVVLIEVRGTQLLEAMEHGLRLYPEQNGGFPQISGGTLVFDPSQEAGQRMVSLEIDGKPVDPNATYLVATNDFMAAGGDDYLMFKESPVLVYGGTLDEALIAHIQNLGDIDQAEDGRIQAVEAAEQEAVPEDAAPEATEEGKAA